MLKGALLLISPEQGQIDFDILRRAVAAAKSIAPRTDGRIVSIPLPAESRTALKLNRIDAYWG